MAGSTNSIEVVLVYFPMPILPRISGELTIKSPIDIHQLISGNVASVVSNLGVGWHGHLALTMTTEYYLVQTGHAFFQLHKPRYYPLKMGAFQEQALRTKSFR